MALRLCIRSMSSTAGKKSVIGFIGLGMMGVPMTRNLLDRGKDLYSRVIVHDAVGGVAEKFASENENVEFCSSPADVAAQADVIFTMLPNGDIVEHVYLNAKNGLINTVKKGTLLIDSSTIAPTTSRHIGTKIMEKGTISVDAPVSGGVLGAKAGTLTFMVGALSKDHFEKVKPFASAMGKNIVYCGTPGMGQVAKICNNMLFGTTMLAVSESLNLGIRLGMDPKLLSSIINTSTGRCFTSESYNPIPGLVENAPSTQDYAGGFGISLMQKDMGLAIAAAQSCKATVLMSAVADQMYKQAMTTAGYEKKDFSVIFKYLNDNAKKLDEEGGIDFLKNQLEFFRTLNI